MKKDFNYEQLNLLDEVVSEYVYAIMFDIKRQHGVVPTDDYIKLHYPARYEKLLKLREIQSILIENCLPF